MFEFLFKYSPVVFSEGKLALNYQPSLLVLLAVLLALAVCLFALYRRTTLQINSSFKALLIALKVSALLILLFLLLEPYVTISTIMPRKSSVLVLIDDSKSMSIADVEGKSRTNFVRKLLGEQNTDGLLSELKTNFKLQLYKFGPEVEHLREAKDLAAAGSLTDLGEGLKFATELGGQSGVSAVVVVTDGVNNTGNDPLETAALMKNKNLPLYVVGVGSEETKDIELARVNANHSVIENSVIEVAALIKSNHIDEKEVEVELREEGILVKKQQVSLKGSATRMSMKFSPRKHGFVNYSLNVVANEKEVTAHNNQKSFLIDNRSKKARVLYVEGYPRAEFKFLRRALDGDTNIELVSLLRTGPDKFYRQGVTTQDELRDGFPKTKEALFAYDAIILGSVERDFFSDEELENISQFVSERGGGFLMLGGRNAFAEGGYAGSVLEPILPVQLPAHQVAAYPGMTFRDKFKLLITPEGYQNPIMQLSATPSDNREMWDKLPDLEGYNVLGNAKPGATILAVHPLSEPQNPRIMIAQQRFGKGRTMVFASSSSWLWQMGMNHADMSHERFWRQIMRWLALAAPKPVEVHTEKDSYVPGEEVTLNVDVRDREFVPLSDARVTARFKKPDGDVQEVPVRWSSEGKLAYAGTFVPDTEGIYKVQVEAYALNGDLMGLSETAFLVEESKLEFSNAHLQAGFLKRMADVSGGRYFHQEEAENLPDEISVMKSSYSKLVDQDLWDMPILFMAVIVLLAVEWYVRRNRGLS